MSSCLLGCVTHRWFYFGGSSHITHKQRSHHCQLSNQWETWDRPHDGFALRQISLSYMKPCHPPQGPCNCSALPHLGLLSVWVQALCHGTFPRDRRIGFCFLQGTKDNQEMSPPMCIDKSVSLLELLTGVEWGEMMVIDPQAGASLRSLFQDGPCNSRASCTAYI